MVHFTVLAKTRLHFVSSRFYISWAYDKSWSILLLVFRSLYDFRLASPSRSRESLRTCFAHVTKVKALQHIFVPSRSLVLARVLVLFVISVFARSKAFLRQLSVSCCLFARA